MTNEQVKRIMLLTVSIMLLFVGAMIVLIVNHHEPQQTKQQTEQQTEQANPTKRMPFAKYHEALDDDIKKKQPNMKDWERAKLHQQLDDWAEGRTAPKVYDNRGREIK